MGESKIKAKRECGTCDLCCTVMGIHELEKPAGERCAHQCGSGCAIYGQHPRSCQEWRCMWLSGVFRDEDKPENNGLVFSTDPRSETTLHVLVDPARSDAWKTKWAVETISRLAQKFHIFIGLGDDLIAYTFPGSAMIYTKQKNPQLFDGKSLSPLGAALADRLDT